MLNARQVEYLLIGGYAVGYYGYPRPTGDMDIWISANPENAKRVVAVLQEFASASLDLSVDLFLKENSIVRMGIPPFRLELITSISGVSFDECYNERTIATIDETEVSIISLRHLKINKKASGRFKDLNDLENLL
ncbi:MAG TPA: hypothetical protein VF791_16015 [Pyrinomonadaceae bacterium]